MFSGFGRKALRSNRKYTTQRKTGLKAIALITGLTGACAAVYYTNKSAGAFGYIEECVHPPHYDWIHDKLWKSYDHAAIRRGFIVYNTLGSACHSMKNRKYRQMVDVCFTEEEAKTLAAEHDDFATPPDNEGDIGTRAGTLNDPFWNPYKNDKEARAMNNGALPPDLSQIVRARHGGESYIFALLTGYRDPPHGITLGENMYYNVYFPGCQIAMPPPLAEGAVTYEDGTPASISQMAKDVAIYLAWSSYMEQDERHLMGLKSFAALIAIAGPFLYWKKFRWNTLKKRQVEFLRQSKDAPKPPSH